MNRRKTLIFNPKPTLKWGLYLELTQKLQLKKFPFKTGVVNVTFNFVPNISTNYKFSDNL